MDRIHWIYNVANHFLIAFDQTNQWVKAESNESRTSTSEQNIELSIKNWISQRYHALAERFTRIILQLLGGFICWPWWKLRPLEFTCINYQNWFDEIYLILWNLILAYYPVGNRNWVEACSKSNKRCRRGHKNQIKVVTLWSRLSLKVFMLMDIRIGKRIHWTVPRYLAYISMQNQEMTSLLDHWHTSLSTPVFSSCMQGSQV